MTDDQDRQELSDVISKLGLVPVEQRPGFYEWKNCFCDPLGGPLVFDLRSISEPSELLLAIYHKGYGFGQAVTRRTIRVALGIWTEGEGFE
jgi:hypothetical protein